VTDAAVAPGEHGEGRIVAAALVDAVTIAAEVAIDIGIQLEVVSVFTKAVKMLRYGK